MLVYWSDQMTRPTNLEVHMSTNDRKLPPSLPSQKKRIQVRSIQNPKTQPKYCPLKTTFGAKRWNLILKNISHKPRSPG